ncbi:hypothetical protein DRQ36_09980 [bacterium]|nr:MAG: hypothetical protein DRQ36_09980 [bacterium]
MSVAPNSRKMPYELSIEEIQLYVMPLLGLKNAKPRSRKWLKRWSLANTELVEFDGAEPVVVKGLRKPLDAQIYIRRELPPEVGGSMPKFLGDFAVRDTVFMVTAVAPGKPPESAEQIPTIVEGLLKLDKFFREDWKNRETPEGIWETDLFSGGIKAAAQRIGGETGERLANIMEKLSEWPINRLETYSYGLMHGDPGVDNAFVYGDDVVFIDGPGEVGPELVDVAYLLQSAAACLDDFETEPTIEVLSEHYNKPLDIMREDLIIADAVAHSTVIQWFDRCATELLSDYAELYDHLIEERLYALERLVENYIATPDAN